MDITPYIVVLVAGLLIGVAGHIANSRILIVTGIVLIGMVSVYFGFIVARVR